MKIKLDTVIEAIQSTGMGIEQYYNKKTGEIVLISDFMFNTEELEKWQEEIEAHWDQYIGLPNSYEINEYRVMENFIFQLEDAKVRDKLDNAIRGRGAFRRFKDMVYELGVEKLWYQYRDNNEKILAIEWCKENGIEYEE